MFFKNYDRISPFYLRYPGEFRVGVMMEITVHFWSFVKKTSVVFYKLIKRDVTITINFENIADDNALFGKVKKKIINFRNLVDTAIGLRVLEIAC